MCDDALMAILIIRELNPDWAQKTNDFGTRCVVVNFVVSTPVYPAGGGGGEGDLLTELSQPFRSNSN